MAFISNIVARAGIRIEDLFRRLGIEKLEGYSHGIMGPNDDIIAEFALTSIEDSVDKTVTSHPIENGSPISDHAFIQPRKVTVSGIYAREFQMARRAVDELFKDRNTLFTVFSGGRSFSNLTASNVTVVSSQERPDASDVKIIFTEFLLAPAKTGLIQNTSLPQAISTQSRGVVQSMMAKDAMTSILKAF